MNTIIELNTKVEDVVKGLEGYKSYYIFETLYGVKYVIDEEFIDIRNNIVTEIKNAEEVACKVIANNTSDLDDESVIVLCKEQNMEKCIKALQNAKLFVIAAIKK